MRKVKSLPIAYDWVKVEKELSNERVIAWYYKQDYLIYDASQVTGNLVKPYKAVTHSIQYADMAVADCGFDEAYISQVGRGGTVSEYMTAIDKLLNDRVRYLLRNRTEQFPHSYANRHLAKATKVAKVIAKQIENSEAIDDRYKIFQITRQHGGQTNEVLTTETS